MTLTASATALMPATSWDRLSSPKRTCLAKTSMLADGCSFATTGAFVTASAPRATQFFRGLRIILVFALTSLASGCLLLVRASPNLQGGAKRSGGGFIASLAAAARRQHALEETSRQTGGQQ